MRQNVQRRVGSTRHEMMRQLPPVSVEVSDKLMLQKNNILGTDPKCVYCLSKSDTNDHFEPLVNNGIPSGIISTQLDIVPCCARCNSSKGGRPWQAHMKRLLETKKITNDQYTERLDVLQTYANFRDANQQTWNVDRFRSEIERLNIMVNECHAFMQNQVNNAVRRMHQENAIVVHARSTELDWSSIEIQIQNLQKNDD